LLEHLPVQAQPVVSMAKAGALNPSASKPAATQDANFFVNIPCVPFLNDPKGGGFSKNYNETAQNFVQSEGFHLKCELLVYA
jgi:hypothetical protein